MEQRDVPECLDGTSEHSRSVNEHKICPPMCRDPCTHHQTATAITIVSQNAVFTEPRAMPAKHPRLAVNTSLQKSGLICE